MPMMSRKAFNNELLNYKKASPDKAHSIERTSPIECALFQINVSRILHIVKYCNNLAVFTRYCKIYKFLTYLLTNYSSFFTVLRPSSRNPHLANRKSMISTVSSFAAKTARYLVSSIFE